MNTVSTMDMRHGLGDILNRVCIKQDEFIIERKGKRLAALVPFEKFQAMRKMAASNILKVMEDSAGYGLSEEAAGKIADDAKHKSRRRK